MKIKTLDALYLDQLQDMHSSETQILKALPKMIESAHHADLRKAFKAHLAETKEHVVRLDAMLKSLGKGAGTKVCEATVGLVKEGAELIAADADEAVRDIGLICAAQKIEHYEIASYGCLKALAGLLGRQADAKHLEATLKEEHHADQTLTTLANNVVNPVVAAHA